MSKIHRHYVHLCTVARQNYSSLLLCTMDSWKSECQHATKDCMPSMNFRTHATCSDMLLELSGVIFFSMRELKFSFKKTSWQ